MCSIPGPEISAPRAGYVDGVSKPGDLNFAIAEKPHARLKRGGDKSRTVVEIDTKESIF